MDNIREILEEADAFKKHCVPKGASKGVIPLTQYKGESAYQKRIQEKWEDDETSKRSWFNKVRGSRRKFTSKEDYVGMFKKIEQEVEKYDSLISKEKEKIKKKAKENIENLEQFVYERERVYNLNWFVKKPATQPKFKKCAFPKTGEFYEVSSLDRDYVSGMFTVDENSLTTQAHIETLLELKDKGISWDEKKAYRVHGYHRHHTDCKLTHLAERIERLGTFKKRKSKYHWSNFEDAACGEAVCEVNELAKIQGMSYREMFFDNFLKELKYVKISNNHLIEDTFEEFNGPSVLVELYNLGGQKLYSTIDPAEPINVRLPFLAFSKADAIEPPTVIFDLCMNEDRKYSFREKTMWEVEKAVGVLYGGGLVKSFYGNPSDKQTIYRLILDEKYTTSLEGDWVDITSKQYAKILRYFKGKEVPSEEKLQKENDKTCDELSDQLAEKLSDILLGEKIPLDVVDSKSGELIIPANCGITEAMLKKLAAAHSSIEIDPSPIRNKIMDIIASFAPKFGDIDYHFKQAIEHKKKKDDEHKRYMLKESEEPKPKEAKVLVLDMAGPGLADLIAANLD